VGFAVTAAVRNVRTRRTSFGDSAEPANGRFGVSGELCSIGTYPAHRSKKH
jgi:hypothetical protein